MQSIECADFITDTKNIASESSSRYTRTPDFAPSPAVPRQAVSRSSSSSGPRRSIGAESARILFPTIDVIDEICIIEFDMPFVIFPIRYR
ncbi:NADPH--cytochrome P450 reductase [Fusarium oxysporum f. sp. albedinis]|nr:NADPH--cytochrome P450 reductase [Fusarium oxysporum f. sp. albedinis]